MCVAQVIHVLSQSTQRKIVSKLSPEILFLMPVFPAKHRTWNPRAPCQNVVSCPGATLAGGLQHKRKLSSSASVGCAALSLGDSRQGRRL